MSAFGTSLLFAYGTLIASKWHREGEHRDVSGCVAKYALVAMQGIVCWTPSSTRAKICKTKRCVRHCRLQQYGQMQVRRLQAASVFAVARVRLRVGRSTRGGLQEKEGENVLCVCQLCFSIFSMYMSWCMFEVVNRSHFKKMLCA
jgi:hypothetical protein